MKFLVSHQGLEQSPMALDEIIQKVRNKEFELFDYIFDESKEDWVLLMEFPPLAERLKSNKPPRPPQASPKSVEVNAAPAITKASERKQPVGKPRPAPVVVAGTQVLNVVPSVHAISEWFVLKGDNRFGPFSYNDLLKMLQQKVVYPFDFIWHAGLEGWKRLVEIDDFKPETIRTLHSKVGESQDLFAERKFKRKPYSGRVIMHDNLSLWKGEGFEISKGGVGVQMANSLVVPGQQVVVHFKQHEEWPAFNAVCEVVSKKFVSDDSPVQYGLRFLSLSQEVQDEFYKKVA